MNIHQHDPSARTSSCVLGPEVRKGLAEEVEKALARGWRPSDLRAWFKRKGVEPGDATKGVKGLPITGRSYQALASIFVVGIPQWPHEPNREAVRAHLHWLTSRVIETPYDDALVEIAYDQPSNSQITNARLFELSELDEAVEFALKQNVAGHNIYVGAGLRSPSSFRSKRCSGEDFYVATAIPVDIDRDYDATRARLAAVCDDGLVVTTGLTPERRSQHWVRLDEPCDTPEEFRQAFASLVTHIGADLKVKDAARVMRLAGTLSFPKQQRKIDAGYLIELTGLTVNARARPSTLEELSALAPGSFEPKSASEPRQSHGSAGEIVRDQWGKVVDGRETYWRSLVLASIAAFQTENGADPTEDEVWEDAYATFSNSAYVDNSDGRWTSEHGKRDLRQRVKNTLRRLRAGRLKDHRLSSIETGDFQSENAPSGQVAQEGEGAQEEPKGRSDRGGAEPPPKSVFDPWDDYVVPEFPFDILPEAVRRFVLEQSRVIGCDASALAMATFANFGGALNHRFALKLMRNGDWWASPRLWVLLVGDPSRKKTPVINTALAELEAHQNRVRADYAVRLAEYATALKNYDAKSGGDEPVEPYKPPRYVVSDTTVEKLGELLARSPRGILVKRDEFAGWIGSMEKYGGRGAAASDRAFWLQSFDGGPFTVDRVARGEISIENLSVSLIGGIQPQKLAELHGLTSDGLLQRFLPIMMGPSTFPVDAPPSGAVEDYQRLTRRLIAANPASVILSDDALPVMEEVRRHIHELEQVAGGFASGFQAFLGKLQGLAGSLALILHLLPDPQEARLYPVSWQTVEKVHKLVVDFILPHAFEFYRTAETVTDGDRLQKIASYILTSRKTRLVSSDLTRNVAGMQGLGLFEMNRKVSPLVAGGWLSAVEPGPVTRSWAVNSEVFAQFEERCRIEEERKSRMAELMKSPRKRRESAGAA